jgi:endonuclease/exonuclease/phosphatase (EEP) superfamily protein YafD
MLAATGEWVASRDNPVVLVGDFNATPWSASFRTLQRRGLLHDTLWGAGLQASWPEGWGPLSIPIDHVLHTADLGSVDRRTGPSFGSAHRPVLVSVGPTG